MSTDLPKYVILHDRRHIWSLISIGGDYGEYAALCTNTPILVDYSGSSVVAWADTHVRYVSSYLQITDGACKRCIVISLNMQASGG